MNHLAETKANVQLRSVLNQISEHLGIGLRDEADADVILDHIPRIPFTILYRIAAEHIEVMRIYDQRSDFSNRHLKQ